MGQAMEAGKRGCPSRQAGRQAVTRAGGPRSVCPSVRPSGGRDSRFKGESCHLLVVASITTAITITYQPIHTLSAVSRDSHLAGNPPTLVRPGRLLLLPWSAPPRPALPYPTPHRPARTGTWLLSTSLSSALALGLVVGNCLLSPPCPYTTLNITSRREKRESSSSSKAAARHQFTGVRHHAPTQPSEPKPASRECCDLPKVRGGSKWYLGPKVLCSLVLWPLEPLRWSLDCYRVGPPRLASQQDSTVLFCPDHGRLISEPLSSWAYFPSVPLRNSTLIVPGVT